MFFDSSAIRDDRRQEFANIFKESGNFFKHADRDPDKILEFTPFVTLIFLIYAAVGLQNLGEGLNATEGALFSWLAIHQPEMVAPEFADKINAVLTRAGVHHAQGFRRMNKRQFFENTLQSAALLRAR